MAALKRKVKTKRWDSAVQLRTAADVTAYLNTAMKEGDDDPAFLTHALGVAARARNMSQLARDVGMTRAGLYRALSEDGNPSFAMIARVARALGYRLLLEPLR